MKRVKCPRCDEWAAWENNPFRPFCSEKCKTRDLGAWASEEYRIAGSEADENDKRGAKNGNQSEE